MANIGMMDQAFFVGRKEIMDWINETLETNLQKVEQTASGAVACQLLDIMHPGHVPMHKVNWAAKQDFEFVGNYKILQTSFTKLQIDRGVDVNRLVQGRYQDNFEFMQWYKRFYETQVSDGRGDYDPAAVRTKGKGGVQYNEQFGRSGPTRPPGASNLTSNAAPNSRSKITKNNNNTTHTATTTTTAAAKESKSSGPSSTAASKASAPPKPPSKAVHSTHTTTASTSHSSSVASESSIAAANSSAAALELAELRAENDDLKNAKTDMQTEMDRLEKERDFYFEKLRDIEMMLQDLEDNGEGTELTANIFKILYATADGFETATAAGGDGDGDGDGVDGAIGEGNDDRDSNGRGSNNNNVSSCETEENFGTF
eukprot:gene199-358_t